MTEIYSIDSFAFVEVENHTGNKNCYECPVADGYKIVVWAIGSNSAGLDKGKKISEFSSSKFNIHFLKEEKDNSLYSFVETGIFMKNHDIPGENTNLSVQELISDCIVAEAKLTSEVGGLSVGKTNVVNHNDVCPECHGVGELDLGFYKRRCMACYKE